MRDLVALPGIGQATARALVAAGIPDVAALAAIDPEAPPAEAAEDLPRADWPAWVAAARAALPAADAEAAPVVPEGMALDNGELMEMRGDVRRVLDTLDHDGRRYRPGEFVTLPPQVARVLDAAGVTGLPPEPAG